MADHAEQRFEKGMKFAIALICVGLLFILSGIALRFSSTPTQAVASNVVVAAQPQPAPVQEVKPQAQPQSTSPVAKLTLLSSRVYVERGRVKVEGMVKNTSTEPLSSMLAVVTWYDANSNLITSNHAPSDASPLLPGQVSHFEVTSPGYRSMDWYEIAFKEPSGADLIYADMRRQTGPGKDHN